MKKLADIEQAKYFQRKVFERLDISLKIVEGVRMRMTGHTESVAILEDPNGNRYTTEEMQTIFFFLENFDAYRKKLIKGLK